MKKLSAVLLVISIVMFFGAVSVLADNNKSGEHLMAGVCIVIGFYGAIWSCVALEKNNEQ